MLNADKPLRWKADIAASVDYYNAWFMRSAPETYRKSRATATEIVRDVFRVTEDLLTISPEDLRANPGVLRTLRMCTAPPIARDRLVGLSGAPGSVIYSLERGRVPGRLDAGELSDHLRRICGVIDDLLDRDLFPWLESRLRPAGAHRVRAAIIVADRLCGAESDPIIRNSQERRQIALLTEYLVNKGYRHERHPSSMPLTAMTPGTFSRLDVKTGERTRVPIDMAIQTTRLRPGKFPILVEAKAAGDFANVNKRRKEEADKMAKLKRTLGDRVEYILLLCGYFGVAYLGHEAAEGIDWVWEHRLTDLDALGI